MMKTLAEECGRPVDCGGWHLCPEDLGRALDTGAFAAVVGYGGDKAQGDNKTFCTGDCHERQSDGNFSEM